MADRMAVVPFPNAPGPSPAGTAAAKIAGRDAGILPLELDSVSLEIGGHLILDRISMRLERGPRTVILGANGAGKSVLLRLCHGLIRPTAGRIVWHGARGRDPARRQAMVFQRPVMLRRTALGNVAYGLKLARVPRRERAARAREMLNRIGLAHVADRAARVLSGGEQQLVSLARAWALEPEILFLDEPTASLDPNMARAVEAIVAAINDAGTKIVMTTHNMGQARRLAEEILFLSQGRLLAQATAAEFFARPSTPEAREFIKGESA
jgi:tungstate transport system ATP-binding protein